MKKALIVLAVLCLLMTAVLGVAAVSADDVLYGDLNGDGSINNRDMALLQQYINKWDVEIDELAADVTDDGAINNRDLALLQQYINKWDVTLGPDEAEDDDNFFNDVVLPWPQ